MYILLEMVFTDQNTPTSIWKNTNLAAYENVGLGNIYNFAKSLALMIDDHWRSSTTISGGTCCKQTVSVVLGQTHATYALAVTSLITHTIRLCVHIYGSWDSYVFESLNQIRGDAVDEVKISFPLFPNRHLLNRDLSEQIFCDTTRRIPLWDRAQPTDLWKLISS